MKFFEAVTIRSRAKAAAKALRDLLAEKTLPATLRQHVENLNQALDKTWRELEGDADSDPDTKAKESALQEGANVGQWLEARMHSYFTTTADDMFGSGYLTREERIILSGAIGAALDAFVVVVSEKAAHLYQRRPWTEPESPAMLMTEKQLSEPEKLDSCVQKVMAKGMPEKNAFAICQAAMDENAKPPKGVSLEVFEMARGIMASPAAPTRETGKKAKESEAEMDIDIAYIPLVEKAVRSDGTIPIRVIQPGWGTSGYYPADVLERDGPKVFQGGTQMFWDHQTPQEEASRPEGELDDMAAVLTGDSRWVGDHPAGPGLYADARVFGRYKEAVDELAPHIGVSIRARGKAEAGTAEGKTGPIIKAITSVKSVDFVTSPGAGGEILQLFEARRGSLTNSASQSTNVQSSKGEPMDEKDIKALQEANVQMEKKLAEQGTQLARLHEIHLLREAGEFVAVELAAVELPTITKSRLLKTLAANPPIKEGKLDLAAYKAQIADAVKAESAYLVEVAGGGRITGMGSSTPAEPKPEELEASLADSFQRIGLAESTAKVAAKGR